MFKKLFAIAALSTLAIASASAQSTPQTPMQPNTPPANSPAVPPIQMVRGQCFAFALPAGWRVLEEGSHAVVLQAGDQTAVTIMTGVCGALPGVDPAHYVQSKILALGAADLRMSRPSPVQPVQGYNAAWRFEFAYNVNGIPCRGEATCNYRQGYNACDLLMTAAAAQERCWAQYAGWLPQVPVHVSALNSGAFGAAGVARQNLQISTAEGENARQYREWSANTWNEVARQRQESQDRQNDQFRQNLGNVTRYDNPYTNRPVELSSNNAVYWINPNTGQIVGSANASFDPRTASDPNWQRMQASR